MKDVPDWIVEAHRQAQGPRRAALGRIWSGLIELRRDVGEPLGRGVYPGKQDESPPPDDLAELREDYADALTYWADPQNVIDDEPGYSYAYGVATGAKTREHAVDAARQYLGLPTTCTTCGQRLP